MCEKIRATERQHRRRKWCAVDTQPQGGKGLAEGADDETFVYKPVFEFCVGFQDTYFVYKYQNPSPTSHNLPK